MKYLIEIIIYFEQFNLCLSPNQLHKSNLDLIWIVYYIKPVLHRVPTIIYSDHYNFHGYTAIYTTPSKSLKKVTILSTPHSTEYLTL